jgi:hypothetical protein
LHFIAKKVIFVVGVTALSTDSSEPQDINDSPKVSYAFQPFSLPLGLRSSAQICQRITTSITFMYFKLGYMMVNYLDDFGGAETNEKGWKVYETLGELLMSCNCI